MSTADPNETQIEAITTDRMIAETRKLLAEQGKLMAEQIKLSAEARKFDRERWASYVGAAGGVIAAVTGSISLAKIAGWL